MSRHVHFVGSVGLDTAEEVFATAGEMVGKHMLRCPDGEMGGRRLWISYQYPVLRSNRALVCDYEKPVPGVGVCPMRLAEGVLPGDVHFSELGYAREARFSYQLFADARKSGKFAPGTRFQVSLPTPFAVIGAFVAREDIAKVLPAYTAAMLREVESICAHIPHQDLAIQWDVCIEMIMWDGRFPGLPGIPGMEAIFADAFKRLAAAVPADVELGYHMCYGDMDAQHFVQPQDLRKVVELTNLIAKSGGRRIDWVHVPVPADRDDEAYFAPLRELAVPKETEVFLGLVHQGDGVEGARRRMAGARKVREDFGIATECGMARARTSELARELIRIQAEAAA
jgi:hypothetical protein